MLTVPSFLIGPALTLEPALGDMQVVLIGGERRVNVLDDLLQGGPSYRVIRDLAGSIFTPVDDTPAARVAFQPTVTKIIAMMVWAIASRITRATKAAQTMVGPIVSRSPFRDERSNRLLPRNSH